MTRTKLKDRILPTYTKGEEIFNMTSHIVGAVLGTVAIVLCVVIAALVTPVLLKLVISKGDAAGGNTEPQPAA